MVAKAYRHRYPSLDSVYTFQPICSHLTSFSASNQPIDESGGHLAGTLERYDCCFTACCGSRTARQATPLFFPQRRLSPPAFAAPRGETQDHQGICLYGRAAGGALSGAEVLPQEAIKGGEPLDRPLYELAQRLGAALAVGV